MTPETTHNPWLDTSLGDYEAHMSLDNVGQAQLLSSMLHELCATHRPRSIALLGCAGGNGLDQVDAAITRRVVAVDVNPTFVAKTTERFGAKFEHFAAFVGSIPSDPMEFEAVELIFAGLLLEYVPLPESMRWISERLAAEGTLATVVQLPSESIPAVTPSPYASLNSLESLFAFRDPAVVSSAAAATGLHETGRETRQATGGKDFVLQTFAKRG